MEQLIIGVFEQGFIYAIMALGVYITYKILDFPDLSVDSTFPLGAAVTTVMLSSGKNPLLALIAATAAGAIAGMVTGIIHVKFKVRDLLSGIIVMTGLYTLNLRIVGGSANVPLFNYNSVFDNDFINGIFPEVLAPYKTVIIIFIRISLKSSWRQRNNRNIPCKRQRICKDRRACNFKWISCISWKCYVSAAEIL